MWKIFFSTLAGMFFVFLVVFINTTYGNSLHVLSSLLSLDDSCTEDLWECECTVPVSGYSTCTGWNQCSADGIRTRTCTKIEDCLSVDTPSPETSQLCSICTDDTWGCYDWGACSPEGLQTRICVITNDCPSVNTPSPAISKFCNYIPSICTSWTYSEWSSCVNGQQMRTILSSFPENCTSGDPLINQSCTVEPVTCTSWTYSEWSSCTDDQQTRTVLTSTPGGCTGGDPILGQSCSVEPVTCTSWTYSDWSTCANNQQTRIVLTSSPSGCSGGSPILNQTCTLVPTITSIFPELISPGAEVTVSGSNFGTYGDYGYYCPFCKIKVNGVSVYPSYNANYTYNWSQSSISFKMPSNATNGNITIVDKNGLESSPFSFTLVSMIPVIISISPIVLIPGETIVTIKGENFSDSYTPYSNQICFGDSCIVDYYIDDYLQSWSDTEIVVMVPSFVTETTGTIGLKLYNASTGYYGFVDSLSYTVKPKPLIEWYYPEMTQGGIYVFSGYNFGNNEGKVVIDGVNAEIINWDDNNVEFKVPENASSGEIYIESADGIKSQGIQVEIVKSYSNDEYSYYQWYLETLNVDKAWDITEGSADVIVAVIDSGVDINHEDLKHAIWTNEDEIPNNGKDDDKNGYIDDIHGWDFILNSNSTLPRGSHGTEVASVIAAEKDNGIGMAGVAPGVTIMPLNVGMFDEEHIDLDAALYAIKYAVDNGATIINLSFGGPESASIYEDVIQYAYDNNVLVIAAAGNEYLEIDSSDYGPVCTDLFNNVTLGVAAISKENLIVNNIYWGSNYGASCVDLSAPGEDLLAAIPLALGADIPYTDIFGGTSGASPLVAGVAALVKSEHPTWNVEEIKSVLLNTAKNLDYLNLFYAGKLGEGLPNAYAALNASKPNVSYNYNPRTTLSIEETNITIEIENPEITPIEVSGPIKDDFIEESTNKSQDQFPDTQGHKNEQAITYLRSIGVINGYPDGTFKPENTVNRAELLKILIEGQGITPSITDYSNCFPDVKTEWFAPYVCYAKTLGWIEGYPNGTFKPAQTVNKVEALKMLLNSQGIATPSASDVAEKPFDDVNMTDWFFPFVARAKQLEILEETGSSFAPNEGMKRAGICENLYRLLNVNE